MAVQVHRHSDRGVAQTLADHLRMDACAKKRRCVCMPQIVNAEALYISLLDDR